MRTSGLLRQIGLISAVGGVCFAQSGPSTTVVRSGPFVPGAPSAWFSVAPDGLMSPQTTTGTPYSAEMITEHKQTLADGTNITETHVQSKIYHDAQGRTRTEEFLPIPGTPGDFPAFIQISDPVAGSFYTLDPQRHTVRKTAFSRVGGGGGNRVYSSMGTTAPGKMTTAIAAPAIAIGPSMDRLQGGQATGNAGTATPRPEISRESLGTRMIEGVQATGTRMTTTYPEGFFGNDRPLKMIFESWVSPELKMTVLSTSSDPRYGETTMRMTDIVQAEPDPSLFDVPSDYQESEEGGMAGGISFDPAPQKR